MGKKNKKRNNTVTFTGFEAHVILCAFDTYFMTDEKGKVDPSRVRQAGSVKKAQSIRDRLFGVHSHEWDDDVR